MWPRSKVELWQWLWGCSVGPFVESDKWFACTRLLCTGPTGSWGLLWLSCVSGLFDPTGMSEGCLGSLGCVWEERRAQRTNPSRANGCELTLTDRGSPWANDPQQTCCSLWDILDNSTIFCFSGVFSTFEHSWSGQVVLLWFSGDSKQGLKIFCWVLFAFGSKDASQVLTHPTLKLVRRFGTGMSWHSRWDIPPL